MWDHDLLRDLLVKRPDIVVTGAVMENADHRGMRPVDWPKNASLGSAAITNVCDFNQHAISMHGRTHGGRRNEDGPRDTRIQGFAGRPQGWDGQTVTVPMQTPLA